MISIFEFIRRSTQMRPFVFLAAIFFAAPAGLAAQSLCASDTGEMIVAYRDNLASSLSSLSARDSIFRAHSALPQIAQSSVSIVQDTAVCRVAAAALVQAWGSGNISDPVWVIKAGTTRYLVFNLKQVTAKQLAVLIFDSSFVHLKTILF